MVMPTNLATLCMLHRPNANPGTDFLVVDRSDGNGPVIAFWDKSLGAKPTDAELDTLQASLSSSADKRAKEKAIEKLASEYLVAFVENEELADDTKILAVRAKIDAIKTAKP